MSLDRRGFLALVGSSIGLAGCGSRGVGSPVGSTRSSETASSSTETATATETPTKNPATTTETARRAGVPYEISRSIVDDRLEITAGQWMAREYFRFFDESADEIKQLWPEHDWWLEITVDFANLGEEPITDLPAYAELPIVVDGTQITTTPDPLPIDWEQVRLRGGWDAYWINPSNLPVPSEVYGGENEVAYLLFDVPAGVPTLIVETESAQGALEATKVHGAF